jgi:hypothetical protein
MELDETGTLARLSTIRAEVVDPTIAKGHGRICNTAGDSVLAEFPSVVDALLYATEIQATIAERNASVAQERRIEYRIGIHHGDVIAQGNDLMGEVVNIAARLEGIAEPGGICVSARVQEDIAGRLDVSFEDIGEPSLKNISRPVRVYRVHLGRATHTVPTPTKGLIALGPEIVCEGEIITFTPSQWEFHLEKFISGDLNALIALAERFDRLNSNDRHLIVNTLGDGRKLAGAPSFVKASTGFTVKCPILPKFPQISARDLGPTLALSEKHDLFLKDGNIARVSGLEALPQNIKTCLSLIRGESPFHPDYGARLAEYYHAYTSPLRDAFLKLEVIRQAAIPYHDDTQSREYTPLQCVERVWGIELLAEAPTNRWLPIRLDFDVAGVGRRQFDISVLIPDTSELSEITARAAANRNLYFP